MFIIVRSSQFKKFMTASELFLLAGNPEWALMISRSASLCEIPGARTGVTRAISTCLTSTKLPSTTGTRLLGRSPEGLRPTDTMLNTSTFRHFGGDCASRFCLSMSIV